MSLQRKLPVCILVTRVITLTRPFATGEARPRHLQRGEPVEGRLRDGDGACPLDRRREPLRLREQAEADVVKVRGTALRDMISLFWIWYPCMYSPFAGKVEHIPQQKVARFTLQEQAICGIHAILAAHCAQRGSSTEIPKSLVLVCLIAAVGQCVRVHAT